MNQKVIYSTLLSPAKTWVEKEEGKEGGKCCIHLHPNPGEPFEVVSKVGFLKQALEENEPLYLGVSHIISMTSP